MAVISIIGRGELAKAICKYFSVTFIQTKNPAKFEVSDIIQDIEIIATFEPGTGNNTTTEKIQKTIKPHKKTIVFSTLSSEIVHPNLIYIPIIKKTPFKGGFLAPNNYYFGKKLDDHALLAVLFPQHNFQFLELPSLIFSKNALNVLIYFHYAGISALKVQADKLGLDFESIKNFISNDPRFTEVPLDWGIWPGGFCLHNSIHDIWGANQTELSSFSFLKESSINHYTDRVIEAAQNRYDNIVILGSGYKKGSLDSFASARTDFANRLTYKFCGKVEIISNIAQLLKQNRTSFDGLIVNMDSTIFDSETLKCIFGEDINLFTLDAA